MDRIKKILDRELPQIVTNWKKIIFISLFVGIFMPITQPFGLSALSFENKNLIISGYGLVVFFVLFFNFYVLRKFFSSLLNNWTVKKQLIWLAWVFFFMGNSICLYSILLFSKTPIHIAFVKYQFFSLFVGFIPVGIVTIVNSNMKLRKEIEEGKQHASKSKLLTLKNEGKLIFKRELNKVIYVKSEGNYIQIYFINQNNEIEKKMLRFTLKHFEDQISEIEEFIKCHRSYIVNKEHILSVSGLSQNMNIHIRNHEILIPISRGNEKKLKDLLPQL